MPWGISHEYKFIFIHIPKTAGTTICSIWEGSPLKYICKETGVLGGTHKSAMELKESYPSEFRNYLKWTVVRNPYDRFVSKFFFKQMKPREEFNLKWTDKESEGLLPQIYWITDRKIPKMDIKKYPNLLRPDTHFGDIIVDRILKYESIVPELSSLFNELGIKESPEVMPHFRQTRTMGAFIEYYTIHMKSLVTYLYREDLERLNYSWEDKRELSADPTDA